VPKAVPIILFPLLLASCDPGTNPFAPNPEAPVDYRPEEAGTVDHALCLLGFTHVPVRSVKPGHQLVEASINGVSGDFVLDTGANMTVVSIEQAERFGLSAGAGGGFLGAGQAVFVGSAGGARQAAVRSFTITGIDVRQRRVLIADLGQLLNALGNVAGRPVSGVIGQDVLGAHRAVIDVSRPMLYIMADDRQPAPVPSEQCKAGA
jgi:hypothetical protein